MSKSALLKLVIALVATIALYAFFWFFKVGQIEKQMNNFVTANSANISVGEISVSGFPLSQKITIKDLKFTIPNSLFSKRQVAVKQVELTSKILSSDFVVSLAGSPVIVQDSDNNIANVEFSKEPEITVSVSGDGISNFSYQDSGYRISDVEKNVIYAASSSVVNFESNADDDGKITSKISLTIKDVEGFTVIDAYKNVFEKGVIEGVRTGEITLGNESGNLVAAQQSASDGQVIAPSPSTPNVQASATSSVQPVANTTQQAPAPVDVANNAVPGGEIMTAVSDSSLLKNEFVVDIEYILTPVQTAEKSEQTPTDIIQTAGSSGQYSKIIRINNLTISNALHKIVVNGELNVFADDDRPSGSVTVKVENVDSLINYVSSALSQIADKSSMVSNAGGSSVDNSGGAATVTGVENSGYNFLSYNNFLKRVSVGLNSVTKELAAKNSVSKDGIAVFDIRREKNLEFLVNETPSREVLGKF